MAETMVYEKVKLFDLPDWLKVRGLRVVSSSWAAGAPAPTAVVDRDDSIAKRPNLNESQRAMIAAKIAKMPQGARTDLRSIDLMSQPDAAQALKVSTPSTPGHAVQGALW